MNINLHYYAVKAIAVEAGMSDGEAQTIAQYCQFINDFTEPSKCYFHQVPDFAEEFVIEDPKGTYRLDCVITSYAGFSEAQMKNKDKEMETIVPFHYPTPQALVSNPIIENRRCNIVRRTDMGESSLVSAAAAELLKSHKESPAPDDEIRLGILLHLFTSTYMNQGFSGLNGWENMACLKDVVDGRNHVNISKDYITPEYISTLTAEESSVGNQVLKGVNEETYMQYSYSQAYTHGQAVQSPDTYQIFQSRNNVSLFLECLRQILEYLCKWSGGSLDPNGIWDRDQEKFRQGLLKTSREDLKTEWKKIFNDINFQYTAKDLMPQKETNNGGKEFYTADDGFFYFQMASDGIRKTIVKEEANET